MATDGDDREEEAGGRLPTKPVIIIGAGVSGLLLAQRLRRDGVAFEIYEREPDMAYRGAGWGLTLHWSLPALQSLLPPDLFARLPESYVDQAAVERGDVSRFPFFDLRTGELKASTPKAPASERMRVTRGRLRRLLATDIDVRWGKAFRDVQVVDDSVIVSFDDGSSTEGSLLIACDGTHSRVRRSMFPENHQAYRIPVRVLGVKVDYSPERIEPLRRLDSFFLQGAQSENDTFAYFSSELTSYEAAAAG
jgi:2-polyprenyl-6-methoxyphenol hydroxylase-like FAD-dependent oxidoreductase